jgi:hypothetical protein
MGDMSVSPILVEVPVAQSRIQLVVRMGLKLTDWGSKQDHHDNQSCGLYTTQPPTK